jgi:hypothetical protein
MKRLGRKLKWVGIFAGIAIAALLVLNTIYVWSTGTRLEKRLAALRSAGEPVQLADLARQPIPPETNAETFLLRAEDDLDAVQKELLALYPEKAFPTKTPSPADRDKLEKLFAAYPKLLPLLEQAADCPDYAPHIDGTLPPAFFINPTMARVARHRRLARVLRAYSALRMAQGRPDDALAAQILVLRLARAWRREPLLIGYLVTLACDSVAMDGVNQILQAASVSPASRQALDAEIALHDDLDGLRWAFQSERAYALSSCRELFGSTIWPPRVAINQVMFGFLDLFDLHLENTARPFTQTTTLSNAGASYSGMLNPLHTLVTHLEPSLTNSRQAAERARALSRSLRVLNALQTHQAPGGDGDRIPDLASLGLPPDATIDPFSDKPLHVKKLPEGWMVYSVGPDGVDDGGNLNGKTDFGFGPINADASPK